MLATFDVVSYAGAPLPVQIDCRMLLNCSYPLLWHRMTSGRVLQRQESTFSVFTEPRRHVITHLV